MATVGVKELADVGPMCMVGKCTQYTSTRLFQTQPLPRITAAAAAAGSY